MTRRIVVTDTTFPGFEAERAVAGRHAASFEEARCSTAEDVLRAATGADVLLVQFCRITSEAIERLAPGAAIVRYGLGLDNVDVKAARCRGVRVAYAPDYATGEVADHTAALILAMLRKLIPLDASVHAGTWDLVGASRPMPSFARAVIGFVGFGRIGREVYARLHPFGFTGIIQDPYIDTATLHGLGARATDLETLFSSADVITLHGPLTLSSQHLVNARRLNLMKPTAVIVNTARGPLIDTVALTEALETGLLRGVALDVFETEPLPLESRLRQRPNVTLTPHAAWYSDDAVERVQALAADDVARQLSGREARCPVPEA